MENYILRGSVILKLTNKEDNNIINLELDEVLSDLSLISNQLNYISFSELNSIIKYLLTNRQFEGKYQVKRKRFEFISDHIKYLGRRIFNFKSISKKSKFTS